MNHNDQVKRMMTLNWNDLEKRQTLHHIEYRKRPYTLANQREWQRLVRVIQQSFDQELRIAVCSGNQGDVEWLRGHCVEMDWQNERIVLRSTHRYLFILFSSIYSISEV